MICRIVCPVQDPGSFDINACTSCRYFNLNRGKTMSVSCRKNRSPHYKKQFEMAYLSNYIGIPDQVVVEAAEEPKK